MKTVLFAGVSRSSGAIKFRTANDTKRADALAKFGDTEINLIKLPKEMCKSEAAKYLLSTNFAQGNAEIDAVLVATATDDNPFAKKPSAPRKPRTVVAKNAVVKTAKPADFDPDARMTPKQAAKIRAEFMKKLRAVYEAN